MIFQIGQFDEVRSATMVSRETLQVQVRERHETEEIRKISRMQKDSIVDSKRFRRSERLQSILGKMRDGRDEEWNQVVQSESIKSSGHTISENETRDQEQTDEAIEPTNIEIRIDHEGGNTIQNEEESQKEPHEWSSSEYGENPETREEPDEIQEREDHIREQINLAVKDSMMGTDGVATMPVIKVLPTKESSGDSSRRGQRVSSPKSPQKNTTSRKSLSSPRGGKRISQRKKEFKGELEEYCSESESSSDRAHQVKSRSSKSKKNLPEKIKSISSDISKDSIISSDSSSSDAGSRGSSDGYSSSSSMKHLTKPEISRKKIIGIETKNLDGEQTKVKSPIAEQASDFIKSLVKNLKLHQTFTVPDKIKNHARSQPIKLAGKSTIAAEKKIDESRLDEEINSIVKKGISRGTRSQPLRRQFKLTTLPRKDVMAELREKLAQRQRIIEDSTKEVTVEQMIVPKEDKRQKLTSQVLKETEKYVETIPRLVSTDTATTRSRPMQASDRCGATCGTLLCFGDSDVSKPLRLKWKRGDFLTVNEALLVLDDSDDWDGASTMASMKGPSFSVEELSAALASRKSLPKDSPVNTESGPIAKQQSACPTGPDHSKSSSDIGVAIFNASSPNAQDRKHYSVSKEDDGGASLAYSNATEDGGEPKILKSSSDDSSMVPLRHGERERSNNSIPRIHVDETVVDDSPGHNMIRASSDELVIALSLSQDSNDSIPIPQRMKSQQGIFVALDDATTQELTDGNTSIWHSSGNMASRSNDEHQEELLAKIQEFQHRKQAQSLTGNDDSNESSTPLVNESATARNIHRRPIRAEVDLPRASKKIAQAYIDALSKKFEGNTIALMKPRIPSSGTPPSDTMVLTTDRSDEMIPAAPTKSKKGNERTKKVVQKPSDPKPEILGLDVRPAPTLADHKSYESRSTARESNGEVYDLVERIDNVVQRLIEVGKIDPSGSSFEGSELEQRTTRSNTQELLQNLAILRARRSSGASSKHDPALSVSSSLVPGVGSSSVPKSLTIPTTTTVSATYKPRPSPRVETKSLQDLRARRDQAAMAVRMSAQRLSGLSKDYSENTNILQETPTPHPPAFQGRSFSSVKLNGPPRPESFSAWVPSRILSATPRKPEKDSFSTIETKSIIERVAVEDRRGSLHFPISLPDALSSDLGDWEQEQLQELPVLLQTTFSGTHAPVGLMDDDYWDKEPDNALEGSDEETENSFSDDDETTDYGSDDDSERLLRIESMIHELRAKRLLRF